MSTTLWVLWEIARNVEHPWRIDNVDRRRMESVEAKRSNVHGGRGPQRIPRDGLCRMVPRSGSCICKRVVYKGREMIIVLLDGKVLR
eukprot:3115199-Rhodomonas_salina.2